MYVNHTETIFIDEEEMQAWNTVHDMVNEMYDLCEDDEHLEALRHFEDLMVDIRQFMCEM